MRDIPRFIVNLVAETGRVDDGQGDAGALLVQLKLWIRVLAFVHPGGGLYLDLPTVMGLILTPSSTWAAPASSESLWSRTSLPQRVLTKVVLPAEEHMCQQRNSSVSDMACFARSRGGGHEAGALARVAGALVFVVVGIVIAAAAVLWLLGPDRGARGAMYLFLRHRRPSDRTEFPSSHSSCGGSSSGVASCQD